MKKINIHKIEELQSNPEMTLEKWNNILKKYKKDQTSKRLQTKWTTLVHNGPVFTDPYKSLPQDVFILYDKKKLVLDSKNIDNHLNLSEEECAVLLFGLVKRFKVKHPKDIPEYAKENFFTDWKQILKSSNGKKIKSLDNIDLSLIEKYFENKKIVNKEEKTSIKEKKEQIKKIYGYAVYDGLKVPVKSAIEPPIAFFSSSEQKLLKNDPSKCPNPKSGKLKKRILPSDVTINGSSIPECVYQGKPCKPTWKITNPPNTNIEWFASWEDPVTGDKKYTVVQRINSAFVYSSDQLKFEKARELKKNIVHVRKRYMKDLQIEDINTKTKAIATYFLDIFSIRPGGNKKEEDEGGIGLIDLTCDNIELLNDNKIRLSFTGKSGVKFEKVEKIDRLIYTELGKICKSKKNNEKIFNITINDLNNNYLSKMIDGITAKSFRTLKACTVFQNELRKNPININEDVRQKIHFYNKANIEVGKSLNHQSDITIEQLSKLSQKQNELELKLKSAVTEKAIEKARISLENHLNKIKEKNSNIATGTSKGNYLDPRITISWAKRTETPIEKIYSNQFLTKFKWAMDTISTWQF